MSRQRFKFSIRSLLACIAAVALLLGLVVRFGGHAVWLATRTRLPTIQSIPASVLNAEPVEEEFRNCNIGPISLGLPVSMCQTVQVRRPGSGGINLHFSDNSRTAIVNLTPLQDTVSFPRTEFPDRVGETDMRLYREIAAVQSSDFSFAMTNQQLRWHKWLVTNRRFIPEVESIEYRETPELEANLLRFSSTVYNFEWGTTDGKWKGAVTFHDPTGNPDWIRNAASTFALRGDPSVFVTATDAELKAMVTSLRDANAPEE